MAHIKMFNIGLLKSHLKHQPLFNNIVYFPTTSSTNNDLWRLYQQSLQNYLVLTDHQVAGKGRGANVWFSCPEKNITCSFVLHQAFDMKKFNFHSLVIPLSIVRGVQKHLSLNLQIKWPNDIMYNNLKVGGILIETKKYSEKYVFNVGIGINVNESSEDFCSSLNKKAISLKMISGKTIQRETLLASILNELYSIIQENNPSKIILEWEASCSHINKNVCFKYNQNNVRGLFQNINNNGQAVIKLNNKPVCYDGAIETL
jgi:BirA family biotin operon repressor/biotin-[acetyl-CoA-carboxylase] ligase